MDPIQEFLKEVRDIADRARYSTEPGREVAALAHLVANLTEKAISVGQAVNVAAIYAAFPVAPADVTAPAAPATADSTQATAA